MNNAQAKKITARGNEEEVQCEKVNLQNANRIRRILGPQGPKEPQGTLETT